MRPLAAPVWRSDTGAVARERSPLARQFSNWRGQESEAPPVCFRISNKAQTAFQRLVLLARALHDTVDEGGNRSCRRLVVCAVALASWGLQLINHD